MYMKGVLIRLVLLLIVFSKKPIFRAFMLVMLAHYVLTYPVT
jgi:hypothetical protein